MAPKKKYSSLTEAVIRQISPRGLRSEALDDLKTVADHGASGGTSGFIYYKDTHSFALKHFEEIEEKVVEVFGSIGEWLEAVPKDYRDSDFLNLVAWFALESAANEVHGEEG